MFVDPRPHGPGHEQHKADGHLQIALRDLPLCNEVGPRTTQKVAKLAKELVEAHHGEKWEAGSDSGKAPRCWTSRRMETPRCPRKGLGDSDASNITRPQ